MGLRLFSLGLILGLVFSVLLAFHLRFDYLRLLLPWYGVPYLVWLIGVPPRREGLGAGLAYVWGLVGTVTFLAAVFVTTRP